jgi:hypothetical protein
MRRTDPFDLIPCEREELERMLNTPTHVKECIRSFEDGEISLRDAVWRMAAASLLPSQPVAAPPETLPPFQ